MYSTAKQLIHSETSRIVLCIAIIRKWYSSHIVTNKSTAKMKSFGSSTIVQEALLIVLPSSGGKTSPEDMRQRSQTNEKKHKKKQVKKRHLQDLNLRLLRRSDFESHALDHSAKMSLRDCLFQTINYELLSNKEVLTKAKDKKIRHLKDLNLRSQWETH